MTLTMFRLRLLPPIYYGWVIVGFLVLVSMYTGGAVFYGFTAIIEPIAQELGWSYAEISLAASIRGFEASLLAPIIGAIVDRYGARRLMFIGIIFMAGGLFLLSQTYTLSSYYGAFILVTLGASATSITAIMTIVIRWFHRRLGLATGITLSGFSLGGLAIPIVNLIIEAYDWRIAIMALGSGTVILIIPLFLILRDRPDPATLKSNDEFAFKASYIKSTDAGSKVAKDVSVKQAMRMRSFWHILFAFVFLTFTAMTVGTHVMPYLSTVEVTRNTSGLVAMSLPLISILGRMWFGWLTDRWPAKTILLLGLLLMAFGVILFALILKSTYFVIPFMLVYSIGFGGAMVLRPSFVRNYFGSARFGSIFGLTISAGMLGGIIGPPLAGWIYDTHGSYQLAWYINIGILVLAMVVILTCPKPENQDHPSG